MLRNLCELSRLRAHHLSSYSVTNHRLAVFCTPSTALLPYHFRTATLSRTAILSRTVLRLNLILPIPYCKTAQKLVANAERSCAVNVKSCSSGGTAWRRKIFRNSRVNGAPLTVFEFESIVIACICVGVCGGWLGGLRLLSSLIWWLAYWQVLEDWRVLENWQVPDDSPTSQ